MLLIHNLTEPKPKPNLKITKKTIIFLLFLCFLHIFTDNRYSSDCFWWNCPSCVHERHRDHRQWRPIRPVYYPDCRRHCHLRDCFFGLFWCYPGIVWDVNDGKQKLFQYKNKFLLKKQKKKKKTVRRFLANHLHRRAGDRHRSRRQQGSIESGIISGTFQQESQQWDGQSQIGLDSNLGEQSSYLTFNWKWSKSIQKIHQL